MCNITYDRLNKDELEKQLEYFTIYQSFFYNRDRFTIKDSNFKKFNYTDNIGSTKTFYKNRLTIEEILNPTSESFKMYDSEFFFKSRLWNLITSTTDISDSKGNTRICSPEFFPLYIGIIFSISKGKKNWNRFIDSTLDYANRFLTETDYIKEYPLHIDLENHQSIYQNFLCLYFSPLLWELYTYIEKGIAESAPIGQQNLYAIRNLLCRTYFCTKLCQDMFYNTLIIHWNKFYFPKYNEPLKTNDEISVIMNELDKKRFTSSSGEIPFTDITTYSCTLIEQISEYELELIKNRKMSKP